MILCEFFTLVQQPKEGFVALYSSYSCLLHVSMHTNQTTDEIILLHVVMISVMKQFKDSVYTWGEEGGKGKRKTCGWTEIQRRSSVSGEFNIWLSDLLYSEEQLQRTEDAASTYIPPPPPSASRQNASTTTDHDMLPWRRLLQPVAKAPPLAAH